VVLSPSALVNPYSDGALVTYEAVGDTVKTENEEDGYYSLKYTMKAVVKLAGREIRYSQYNHKVSDMLFSWRDYKFDTARF